MTLWLVPATCGGLVLGFAFGRAYERVTADVERIRNDIAQRRHRDI